MGEGQYREGVRYVDCERFAQVIQETAKSYLSVLAPKVNLSASVDLSQAIGDSEIPWRDCPIYLIHDEIEVASQPVDVLRFDKILIARETNRFKKAFKRLDRKVQEKWLRKRLKSGETSDLGPWSCLRVNVTFGKCDLMERFTEQ